ncbi:glycosyltransferase family 4 protein (plasmid) [Paracoccus liaowanqingii]|uniref:Glycosyltransferase family 4 protein n=1 Tax=Paracoccus liaowanqingii TaxID=2560053 RepID=A0A4Y5STD5_9RHOB|nr:glycosyltransferase family 4 protein [Paracoccus liaowanqingii]QDA36782.1 glycosyltransferase family 4 protein [Paracoccus liaowanqingii]
MTLRILHLLNHTRRSNGHVHAAVDLACEQRRTGHDVMIASAGGDFDDLLTTTGVETALIDHTRKPRVLFDAVRALRRVVRTWRPDVVHAHMMTSAVLAWPVCRHAEIPLITTVHNGFEKSAILMGLGTRVIAVSAAVGVSMRARGVPARKLDVVLNGTIGSARFRNRDNRKAALTSPTIVFVGGLHPRKGLPDLMHGFAMAHARFPNSRLCVVGEGPHGKLYRQMAADLACADAVTFAGSQVDPYRWMLGADIFVLPSLADPAPLVLPEAREAGCAVIATRVDGIPELLEDGKAGILVPKSDPAAICAALCKLLEDPDTLADWRANSQIGIDRLRIDRVAKETLAVYAKGLESKARVAAVAGQEQ